MPTQIQLRRGTTSEHASFTGAAGEVTVDTTKKTLVVHDGSTAGGIPMAKENNATLAGNVTVSGGTANGVAYLNGSKVLTTGSALTFDGTTFRNSSGAFEGVDNMTLTALVSGTNSTVLTLNSAGTNGTTRFQINGSNQMFLTSTGLGVGQSSPAAKLDVLALASSIGLKVRGGGNSGINILDIADAGGSGPLVLNASGNLGIGTSSPSFKLHVDGTQRIAKSGSGYEASMLSFSTNAETGAVYRLGMATGGAFAIGRSDTSTTNLSIDSSGNLLVGTTSPIWTATSGVDVLSANVSGGFTTTGAATSNAVGVWHKAASGDNIFVTFGTESSYTARGNITYNRTAGLVAYNTTSDYRAKDILGPVANSGAIIDALKVYEGKMKGATQSRPMLVAHEAQQHAPYAVTGEKDAVAEDGTPKFQQMDVSSLVPLLLAELQSLRARVAQLEQGA